MNEKMKKINEEHDGPVCDNILISRHEVSINCGPLVDKKG